MSHTIFPLSFLGNLFEHYVVKQRGIFDSQKEIFALTRVVAVFVPFRFVPTARLLSSLQNDGIYVRIITTLNNNFRTVRIPLESPHAVSRVQLASGYSNTKSNYP